MTNLQCSSTSHQNGRLSIWKQGLWRDLFCKLVALVSFVNDLDLA